MGKPKKIKIFWYLQSAQALQSFSTYRTISCIMSSGHRLKKYVPVHSSPAQYWGGGDKSPKWWFWLVSWAKWHGLDLTRCLKPPEIFFDPQGGPGGGLRGAAGGPNFRVYSSSITEESEMLWYWARGLKFWKSPTWDWKKYNERKIFKKNWK